MALSSLSSGPSGRSHVRGHDLQAQSANQQVSNSQSPTCKSNNSRPGWPLQLYVPTLPLINPELGLRLQLIDESTLIVNRPQRKKTSVYPCLSQPRPSATIGYCIPATAYRLDGAVQAWGGFVTLCELAYQLIKRRAGLVS